MSMFGNELAKKVSTRFYPTCGSMGAPRELSPGHAEPANQCTVTRGQRRRLHEKEIDAVRAKCLARLLIDPYPAMSVVGDFPICHTSCHMQLEVLSRDHVSAGFGMGR